MTLPDYSSVSRHNAFLLAEAVFLPDYVEKDFNFSYDNSPPPAQDFCKDFRFTKTNCPAPRTVSEPCPADSSKFKYCSCDDKLFKYNAENCKYFAESPYTPNKNRLLSGNLCKNGENAALLASGCNCKYFRYTSDASCADPEKILDTRSSCLDENGIVRYENCKCNPKLFPYSFVGKLRSQAFLDKVRSVCGNENNFLICQNYGQEIAFKCAVEPIFKYDTYSCQAENSAYEVGGNAITFFNGYGNSITLYTDCDCPQSYSPNCDGILASRFFGDNGKLIECRRKSPICQMGFFKGMSDVGATNCFDNIHGSIVKVSQTCIKRDGSKVYRCKCAFSGNHGYTGDFCGTCVKNSDHIFCLQDGKEISNSCFNSI